MNETALTIKEPKEGDILGIAKDYLNSLGCRLKESDKVKFIEICRAFRLNPFIREIYGIPYRDTFNIVVGYETYLKRAEKAGQLSGWKAWTEPEGEKDIKAIIEIKRKDWETPFKHEVYLSEYKQTTKIWQEKPLTMIKKVAISQGFRLAFPVEMGGLPYTPEELPLQIEMQDQQTPEPYPRPELKQNDQVVDAAPIHEELEELEQDQPDGEYEEDWALEGEPNGFIQNIMKMINKISEKKVLEEFMADLKENQVFNDGLSQHEQEEILKAGRTRYKQL